MRLRNSALLLGLVGVVAAACAGGGKHTPGAIHVAPTTTSVSTTMETTTTSSPPTTRPAQVKIAGTALTPFASCGAFLSAVRSEATAEVTPWGLPTTMAGGSNFRTAMPMAGGAAAMPQSAAAAPAATSDSAATFSTTNNQEAGVDEPDIVKTDGHLLVSLRSGGTGQQVQVVDLSASPARQRSSITLPNGSASGLFLLGSDVVVLGSSYPTPPGADAAAPTPYAPSAPLTQVWVYSVANPDHPTLSRTITVSGSEEAARLIGHSIKLVVESGPSIVFPGPAGPAPADQQSALAANRAIIAKAPLGAWLPTVTDASGHKHLADCGAVSHPADRSGVATISVVSIDPDQGQPGPAVTVLGNPGTVYASNSDLYVATTSYDEQQAISQGRAPSSARTLIHQFDITSPAQATYRGSGAVPGTLLNQYALSEYQGDLRVATTTGTPSPPPFEGGPVPAPDGSESMVTVLRPSGGALVQVGRVGGLGRTQRIYGVRFVGPQGYVVTFRQMDPLYVVDLADPSAPAVRGALELTGYSAYLHPLTAGRLLGVGSSADPNGRRTGMQVSLFDVSNPAHPALLGQSSVPQGNASAENDPHAFLWWEPTGLVVLPVQQWSSSPPGAPFEGAIAYRVSGSSVSEIARLSHPSTQQQPPPPPYSGKPQPGAPSAAPGVAYSVGPQIQRALIVGDRLYTVSEQGVLTSDLHSIARISWLAFA